MASPGLIKAQNELASIRSSLSTVRSEKRAAPMAGAMKAFAGNLAGGALVGAIHGGVDTDLPVEVAVSACALTAAWFTKSPFLAGIAGGSAAVAIAEAAEKRVALMRAK